MTDIIRDTNRPIKKRLKAYWQRRKLEKTWYLVSLKDKPESKVIGNIGFQDRADFYAGYVQGSGKIKEVLVHTYEWDAEVVGGTAQVMDKGHHWGLYQQFAKLGRVYILERPKAKAKAKAYLKVLNK